MLRDRPIELKEWAYNRIKQGIMDNSYPVDTQINIDEVAAELNISRTPVREALIQLQHHGMVRIVPRVGCFVNRISREDFRNIFEVRRIVEGYAALRAAEAMTDERIDRIEAIIRESEQAVREADYARFNKLETMFHDDLLQGLQNPKITAIMDEAKDSIGRERMIAKKLPVNVRKSMREHRAIFEALKSRKPEQARKAMEKHIRNVEERIAATIFRDGE